MKIAIVELKTKVIAILEETFSKQDAERIVDYLLWAEMSGNKTQGLLKMTGPEPLQHGKATSEVNHTPG